MNYPVPRNILASLLPALIVLSAFPANGKVPPQEPARGPIAQQILGAWKVDVPKTLKAMKENGIRKNKDAEAPDDTIEVVKAIGRTMMLEFQKPNTFTAHLPHITKQSRFKIEQSNGITGEYVMKVGDAEDEDTAKGRVLGDTMILQIEADGLLLHLQRLTKAQAKAHLAALKEGEEHNEPEVAPKNAPEPDKK